MSKIQEFLDHLKADNVFESMVVIKAALAEKAREAVLGVNTQVAEQFGLKAVIKEADEKDEDEDEDSDKEDKDSEKDEDEDKSEKEEKSDEDDSDDEDKDDSEDDK